MAEVDSVQVNESPRYRRLRGLRWSGGRSALRFSHDHLLLCDYRTGFVERYKRFYFRDIEAIIVRKTLHWIGAMAVWAFLALFFLLVALGTHWNAVSIVISVICAFFILRNLILGPSCRTHLQTAVQTDALPMLKRVRKTKRILPSIFALLDEAQGKLEKAPAVASMPIPQASTTAAASMEAATATIPHELSWLHILTFVLTLLSGFIAIWEVNYSSTASFAILIVLFCLTVVCVIVALVRQARHPVHRAAAAMIWLLAISYIAGGVYLNVGFSMFSTIRQSTLSRTAPPPPYRQLTPFQMRPMPGFDYVLWAFGTWSVLVALVGLIFVFMPAPARAQPPPLPSPKPA